MWRATRTKALRRRLGCLLLVLSLPLQTMGAAKSGTTKTGPTAYGIAGTPVNDSMLRQVLGRGEAIAVNGSVPSVVLWDEVKNRGRRTGSTSFGGGGSGNHQSSSLTISGH